LTGLRGIWFNSLVMKKILACTFILLTLGIITFAGIAVISAISPEPCIVKGPELAFDKVKRVKQLIRKHTPRYMRFRQTRTLSVREQDLNLLLDYGISQGLETDIIHADIHLAATGFTLEISLKIPKTFLGEYINLALGISHDKEGLDIAFIRAGKLTVPGIVISPFIPTAKNYMLRPGILGGLEESLEGIKSISTRGKTLTLVYDWNPNSLLKLHENGKTLFIPRVHQEKLVRYTNQLTRILDILETRQGNRIPLARVIRPLFQLAADHSEASGDPVLENTALLQSFALYALGQDLDHLVSSGLLKDVHPRRWVRFTLGGRTDLAKHFLVSSGLAVSAGTRLSQFAGLAKEVEDAGRGSGFSFADLAADRAGVKLGELAGGSLEQAQQIQDQMAAVATESDFMPGIADLPEGIMELEFKKRYTDLDSQAYGLIDREISRRLNDCRVYQDKF